MDQSTKPNVAIIALIAVALIGLLATGVWLSRAENSTKSDMAMTESMSGASMSTESGSSMMAGSYQDGTYEAEGSYGTPGGQESVDVKLTLRDGKVSDVTVRGNSGGGESEEYQAKFISGYKQLVVGKPIDGVVLDRVAGSSLTSDGFNDALERIKEQAAAA